MHAFWQILFILYYYIHTQQKFKDNLSLGSVKNVDKVYMCWNRSSSVVNMLVTSNDVLIVNIFTSNAASKYGIVASNIFS